MDFSIENDLACTMTFGPPCRKKTKTFFRRNRIERFQGIMMMNLIVKKHI